jgi:DNA-binding transcriptional LysR family regulator
VAEEQNVTRAARRLRVAQPALSRTIRNLEQEVGIVLLRRVPGGVELTPAGRSFLPDARRTLAEAAGAIARAKDARSSEGGPLVVAVSVPELRETSLERVLMTYRRALPAVQVHIEAMGASAQWDALHRRAIDVGVAYTVTANERHRLTTVPLYDDAIAGVVVSAKHRLARRKSVRLHELSRERLIMIDRAINPEVHDLILRGFHMVGFVPHEFTTDDRIAENSAPTMALVAAGHAWTMLPNSVRRALPSSVQYIPLADFAVPVTLQIMHRLDDRSTRTRTFVRIACQKSEMLARQSDRLSDRATKRPAARARKTG